MPMFLRKERTPNLPNEPPVTAVILDCDPGHDDAIALLLALGSPEVQLLGVTTVSGNQTLENTTANAIRVLEHLGRGDIPVAAGADRPLVRERRVAANVHGETGLDGPDLPPPGREPVAGHAIDWIANTLSAGSAPVTLVPTGPLTNIALLLSRYPDLTEKIERIVLMGGAIGVGNTTPAAEFNIWADPEAARRVFSSGPDITMVGLDVTHKALMRQPHVDRLAAGGVAGKLVADLYAFYARHHRLRYEWDGAPVHDAVAMAHVIDATLLDTKHCGVKVDTGSELSRGRTYVDLWGVAGWTPNCRVAVDIDAERFLELLIERITGLG
jgi:inosine-uridine nucleoside N-ribohydrolase